MVSLVKSIFLRLEIAFQFQFLSFNSRISSLEISTLSFSDNICQSQFLAFVERIKSLLIVMSFRLERNSNLILGNCFINRAKYLSSSLFCFVRNPPNSLRYSQSHFSPLCFARIDLLEVTFLFFDKTVQSQ